MRNKIPFQWKGYAILALFCIFYWSLDSAWSYLSFEYNLKKMIFTEPTSYLDTFLLRVSPYQIVSRLTVLLLSTIIGILVVRFIKGNREAEHERRAAHDNLLNVLNSIDAAVYVSDMEQHDIIFMNQSMIDRYGGDYTGKNSYDVIRRGRSSNEHCGANQLLKGSKSPGVVVWEEYNSLTDEWFVNYDRSIKWVDGRRVHLQIAIDITNQKRNEEELKTSLQEKETLLQEIHHRVKNNMQIIISLLSSSQQHAAGINGTQLEDIINRIRVFSDIHQHLYMQENNLSRIDFAQHLKENFKHLVSTYSINNVSIDLDLDIDQPVFTLDQAMSCGLLLNELITNSIKYAFTKEGKIGVSIRHNEDGTIESITYRDNGKGLQTTERGFGTKIIHALAEQMGLSVETTSHNGISVQFGKKKPEVGFGISSGKILYVEDEMIIAMEKTEYLRKNGYAVDGNIIKSGERAVEYVQNSPNKPALIMMDIGLKGKINGIEAAENIRRNHPEIPIIFLSGYENMETKRKAARISNTRFLSKTAPWPDIIEAIDQYQVKRP